MDISAEDRDLAIRTIMGEVNQGDPDSGRAAVASVILNRLRTGGDYGDTMKKVVRPNQFNAWYDQRKLWGFSRNSPDYQHAGDIFDAVANGTIPDPTGGATHYFEKRYGAADPPWSKEYPFAGQIGSHRFYYGQGSPQASAGASGDLLGSWPTAPAANASSAPAAAPQAAPAEDLLGSWPAAPSGTPATAAGEAPPAVRNGRIVITPAGTPEPAAPAASQDQDVDLAKSLAEHQGVGFGDLAARLGIGALRGVKDVADTAAQGIAAVGRGGAGALSSMGVISPETAAGASDWAAGVNARIAAEQAAWEKAATESPSAQVGRIGGQVAAAGPALRGAAALLPAIPAAVGPLGRALIGGAGYGGGAAALTSAASDQPLPEQIALGAGSGALMGPAGYGLAAAGRGVSRALFGAIDPQTAQLAGLARDVYGIPVTGGQIASNPMVRFADSVLQRMPLTGYGKRTVEQQTGLNRAVAAEMGVSSDKITPDVVRRAKGTAYQDYDFAKSIMGPLHVDQKFLTDLQNVQTSAHYSLEPNLAKLIDKHLDNVADKVNLTTGTLDPDLFQSLTRKNGPLDTAINSRDSKISTHAQGIKDALENLVGRNDPMLKRLKDEADYKYFVAKSIEDAHLHASPTGDVSPAKLLAAVKYSERGVGELGQIGQRFLKEPPSSGTAERLFSMELGKAVIGGALGLGGAYAFDPEHIQRDAILGALAAGGGYLGSKALRSDALANSLIAAGRGVSPLNAAPNFVRKTAPLAGVTGRSALGYEPTR